MPIESNSLIRRLAMQNPQGAAERIITLKAENERLLAIANAGHAEDCGGFDLDRGMCGCGWLQREGAAKCIATLESENAELRRERDLLMDLYTELEGCTWRREDGGENRLAVAMANIKSALAKRLGGGE